MAEHWVAEFEDEDTIDWTLQPDSSCSTRSTIGISVYKDEKNYWVLDTPLGRSKIASKEEAVSKAAEWMQQHTSSKQIARQKTHDFIAEVLEEPTMSFLVKGKAELREQLEIIIKESLYLLSTDELEELLNEIYQAYQDKEIRQLIEALKIEKPEFEKYIENEWTSREKAEQNWKIIDQKRTLIKDAELVTNKDLKGKTILIESYYFKEGEEVILCHIKGDKRRKLKFRPTQQQISGIPFFSREDYPYERRIAQTPKRHLFIFIKPVQVNVFRFKGRYFFQLPYGGKQQSWHAAYEQINEALQEFYIQERRIYVLNSDGDLERVKETFSRNDYYDFNLVEDNQPYLIWTPMDKEPKWSFENYAGERKEYLLSDISLATSIEGDKKIYIMASAESVDHAVRNFKAKRIGNNSPDI